MFVALSVERKMRAKFSLRNDEKDPYHTIINLYNKRKEEAEKKGKTENILDIYNGYDLTITITAGKPVPPPTIIDAKESSPLSEDPELMKKWIYDSKKWQDVFSTKPYEYLALISEMKTPWYDREKGKWVDKTEIDAKRQAKAAEEEQANKEIEIAAAKAVQNEEPQPARDFTSSLIVNEEDDLPF